VREQRSQPVPYAHQIELILVERILRAWTMSSAIVFFSYHHRAHGFKDCFREGMIYKCTRSHKLAYFKISKYKDCTSGYVLLCIISGTKQFIPYRIESNMINWTEPFSLISVAVIVPSVSGIFTQDIACAKVSSHLFEGLHVKGVFDALVLFICALYAACVPKAIIDQFYSDSWIPGQS